MLQVIAQLSIRRRYSLLAFGTVLLGVAVAGSRTA